MLSVSPFFYSFSLCLLYSTPLDGTFFLLFVTTPWRSVIFGGLAKKFPTELLFGIFLKSIIHAFPWTIKTKQVVKKSDLYGLLPLAGQTNPNGRVQFVIGKF
jgi:hypothetical protein